jgi:CubicO group peptidase (beta-lactamase class C family)
MLLVAKSSKMLDFQCLTLQIFRLAMSQVANRVPEKVSNIKEYELIATMLISLELFNLLRSEPSVWKAGQRPGYSNLAFIILAYALETITGKIFAVLLEESISTPLGLSHTRIDPPEDWSRAIIPAGPGGFVMGYDIGNYNACVRSIGL